MPKPPPKPKKAVEALDDAMPELAIPLPEDGIGSLKWWNEEIEQAQKRRKKEIPRWKKELDSYRDQGNDKTFGVNVNFSLTEQKKNQLFYKTPGMQLKPLQTGVTQFLPAYQKYINAQLGPKQINAKAMMDEANFDELVPAGLGFTKIGWECVTVDGTTQMADPSGEVDPLTMQPKMIEQIIPDAIKVYDRFYWMHVEPTNALKPVGFYSMNHDDAPWLAQEFQWDKGRISATFSVGKDAVGDYKSDQSLAPEDDREFATDTSNAIEIWYKASLIDPTVLNPLLYRRLVLIKGRKEHGAVVHENSPYQRFDANGKFVQGMVGSPIHVFSLRSITQTAYPPSDCQMTRKLRDELSALFRIFKKQRQRSLPMRGVDKDSIEKSTVEQIRKGEQQEIILFNGDPAKGLVELARANLSQETFEFVQVYEAQLQRMWSLGSNQQGAKQDSGTTATESSLIQQWVETRMAAERERTLQQFTAGVEKLSACFQLFADQAEFVRVLGETDAMPLQAWDRQGRFEFEAMPDSSIHINAQENQALQLRKYNLLANDPFVNRAKLIEGVALAFNDDPRSLMKPPPPPQPEQGKVSLSLKGDDLGNVVVLQVLKGLGYPISDIAILAATIAAKTAVGQGEPVHPSEHGGAADETAPVSKHDADLSGKLPGPGIM